MKNVYIVYTKDKGYLRVLDYFKDETMAQKIVKAENDLAASNSAFYQAETLAYAKIVTALSKTAE